MEKRKIKIAAVRVNAGLSQEELAEKMNVSRTSIVNWENGKTGISSANLLSLAQICNWPVEQIFLPK